jgi:hypothetical protein
MCIEPDQERGLNTNSISYDVHDLFMLYIDVLKRGIADDNCLLNLKENRKLSQKLDCFLVCKNINFISQLRRSIKN